MSKVTTRVGTRKLNQNQAMPNNEQGVDTTAPTAGTSSATSAPAEPMSAQEMMRMMTQAMVSSMQEVVKEAMRKGTAEIAVSSHAASTTTASPTTSTELWRHGMQVTPFDGTLLDLERFVTDIRRKLESVTAPEKDKVDFVLGHLGVAARRYCSHVKFETAEALLEYIMNVYGVKNSKNNALREIIQAVADPKISARHFKKVMLLNVPKAELTDDLVRRFIVLQAEDKGVRDVAKELCKDTTEMTWIDALNELVESMPSKADKHTVLLRLPKFMKHHPRFHVSRVKAVGADGIPGRPVSEPRPIHMKGEKYYQAEKIVDSFIDKGTLWYKVKWTGVEEPTVEPWEVFGEHHRMTEAFHKANPNKPTRESAKRKKR
ncbi:hypothetical protein CAOG_02705 [Capsaspora owczarzaki ATCC 30864]|uniref:hypothetical protein n=1 Tax=Capsaspora owczarzaki (strain ATCC 30864) TaxID=595528 RepID=UPI0001FE4026|nr:hypothetical protein CAOG_02705 [Capsaspora owczarzaki ATCC 30864]|eukprot:XP_004349455.1 hypothetical protein CAOG_02705 [Capsaspora owczarzaki ATCC 30864]